MDVHAVDSPAGRLQVRLARSFVARLAGWQWRAGVAADAALLLYPCAGIHTCGMRFAIDAVYLDSRGRELGRHRALRPWRFAPAPRHTAMVLELPAGRLGDGDRAADWCAVAELAVRRAG